MVYSNVAITWKYKMNVIHWNNMFERVMTAKNLSQGIKFSRNAVEYTPNLFRMIQSVMILMVPEIVIVRLTRYLAIYCPMSEMLFQVPMVRIWPSQDQLLIACFSSLWKKVIIFNTKVDLITEHRHSVSEHMYVWIVFV